MFRFKKVRILCASSGNDYVKSQKQNEMIVSITGATGLIGKRLVQRLHADNHRVRVLTRSRPKALSSFPGKKSRIFLELK
ncbi:epimerase family protein SDR39U1 homolog, chloroplastic-like isoform X2 [Primulina eburnea]|uniref:epimerase family protein SDR39U1 homolog, chloroplastic-like isoform X2 n=1 Tax=Primulina eburnea TaxID=1245227 RepID=UPI003C6C8672